MEDERIRAFERDLWTGGEEVYRERVAEDCLMVLPAMPYVYAAQDAIRAVSKTPRWNKVELDRLRVSRPQEGLIVIAYEARAERGEQRYRAFCTSVYRRRGADDWQVVQHQQTLPTTE